MRTIGIDLGISAGHKAVVANDQAQFITPVMGLRTDPADLERLMRRARAGTDENEALQVVMEPTGLSWVPVASYFIQRGVTVYLVSTQQVHDLRKFYSKHAKSDRISARVLVRWPWVNPEALQPLRMTPADYLSGQRWCKQQDELSEQISAIKNRVQAWERAFWPGLKAAVGNPLAPWMRRWREVCYDPWELQAIETEHLATLLADAGADPDEALELARGLKTVARRAVGLYGAPEGGVSPHVDYAALQDQVVRELRLLTRLEAEHQAVREQVQRLYRRMHPSRDLESLRGVGEDGAAVYFFFVAQVERFGLQKQFRSWSGLIPGSDQSGDTEKKGVRITKAGPDLVKKYAYINADVGRQWDPQLAAVYYDQMMHKGKHHCQAVCCCATHLLDRVRAVLRDGRPYQLRDVDGTPVTRQQARQIVLERYQVPDEVRRRRSHQARKHRRDRQAERKQKRRSRQVSERLTPQSHLS